MTHQNFDSALVRAVDFAFYSLGKSCRRALYFHLRTTFHVKRMEIPSKIQEFDNALGAIFKDGAVYLEKLIVERLQKELDLQFEEKSAFDFVEIVSHAKLATCVQMSSSVFGALPEHANIAKVYGGGKPESEG